MKRTILAVLMVVMIAIPCLAQEIGPDGIFSIGGTVWQALPIGVQILPYPGIWPTDDLEFGFDGGQVYPGGIPQNNSFYIDMLVCSVFSYRRQSGPGGGTSPFYFGILQPTGIGILVQRYSQIYPKTLLFINIALLIKTDDNWAPPEFGSISPNQGEQGTLLTDVTITGVNTPFQDDPPVEISFRPPDGLTVSNINVINNTEIEFDLEIAVDAPVGMKQLIVRYGDRNKYVYRDNVFEVLERTN
jgi:hypothetical protein